MGRGRQGSELPVYFALLVSVPSYFSTFRIPLPALSSPASRRLPDPFIPGFPHSWPSPSPHSKLQEDTYVVLVSPLPGGVPYIADVNLVLVIGWDQNYLFNILAVWLLIYHNTIVRVIVSHLSAFLRIPETSIMKRRVAMIVDSIYRTLVFQELQKKTNE